MRLERQKQVINLCLHRTKLLPSGFYCTSRASCQPRTELIRHSRAPRESISSVIVCSRISPCSSSQERKVPARSPAATGGVSRSPSTSRTMLPMVVSGDLAALVPEKDVVSIGALGAGLLVDGAMGRFVEQEEIVIPDRASRQRQPDRLQGRAAFKRSLLNLNRAILRHQQANHCGQGGQSGSHARQPRLNLLQIERDVKIAAEPRRRRRWWSSKK